MNDNSLLVSFGLYLAMLLVIGGVAYRLSNTLSDYVLGGRRLGAWVVAISSQASDMSGWLLIGVPGELIKNGVSMVWTAIGCVLGNFFNWGFLARRLRRYSEILEAITVPDFLASRYHGQAEKTIRVICLFVVVLFYIIYIGAQFKAAGKTLESTFDISYHNALVLSAVVIILYTMMGGFFAVSWTDLIQGMIMVFVVVILPVLGIIHLGGIDPVIGALADKSPDLVKVSRGFSGWDLFGALILGGLAWGLGYPGMPHITVRYMSIRDDRDIKKSALISIVWVTLALWGSMAVGAVGLAELGDSIKDPEKVLPMMANLHLPGWLAGVVIAAIAAAIMSTVDSQILVLSSAVVEDFYRKLLHSEAPQRLYIIIGRMVTLAIGVFAVIICWNSERGVFGFVMDAWSGLAAAFGPALIMSLRWKRTTGWGVAAGMASGVATVLVWRNLDATKDLIWELFPGFIVAMLMIIIVSKLTPRPGAKAMAEYELAADRDSRISDEEGKLISFEKQQVYMDTLRREGGLE